MQAKAKDQDGKPPGEEFDSNCITPGTPFMARLGNHLRFYFRNKIAKDAAWQKPRIIFSGGFVCW